MPHPIPSIPCCVTAFGWLAIACGQAFGQTTDDPVRLPAGRIEPATPPIVYRGLLDTDAQLSQELAKRKLVVIYYANNLYPILPWDPICDRIRAVQTALDTGASSDGFTPDQRQWLAEAAKQYARESDEQYSITELETSLLQKQVGRKLDALVVFRNWPNFSGRSLDPDEYLFRQFQWLSQVAGDDNYHMHTLPIPLDFHRPEYDSQPLAHPAMLAYALETVAKTFDPETHRYLLIVRSPTTRDNALALPVAVDVAALDAAEVCRELLNQLRPNSTSNADANIEILGRVNLALLDAFPVATASENPLQSAVQQGVAADHQVARSAEVGTSKSRLLASLNQTGGGDLRKGMCFPVVVLASPRSELELASPPILLENSENRTIGLRNVGTLYTWGGGETRLNPLDSRALFEPGLEQPAGDMDEVLKILLEAANDSPQR